MKGMKSEHRRTPLQYFRNFFLLTLQSRFLPRQILSCQDFVGGWNSFAPVVCGVQQDEQHTTHCKNKNCKKNLSICQRLRSLTLINQL